MTNYMVRFQESERENVLSILSRSNDIVINKIEPTSALITIQVDNSDEVYELLLEKIDKELHGSDVSTS